MLLTNVPYEEGNIVVRLLKGATEEDWFEVKRRALKTIWKVPSDIPESKWRSKILDSRHSPIRYLRYSFELEFIPSNTATHFARHIHIDKYISTLRNDLQDFMDGDHAPRNTPVGMIMDINGESMMTMANKRLCLKCAPLTIAVMQAMCDLVLIDTPEYKGKLVPLCEYCNGVCHEMKPCGRYPSYE